MRTGIDAFKKAAERWSQSDGSLGYIPCSREDFELIKEQSPHYLRFTYPSITVEHISINKSPALIPDDVILPDNMLELINGHKPTV